MNHSEEITPEILHQTRAGEETRSYKTYESRIVFAKKCHHCQSGFWPKRRDQKYCSASCRVVACRERKGYTHQAGKYQKPLPVEQPTLGNLPVQNPTLQQKFSWQNVGESAVGSAAVAGVKYLAHDLPMMQKLDKVLQHLEGKSSVQSVKTPVSKLPLHFLGLHKLTFGTIALFRDPKTRKLIAQDEKGRWMRQISTQPERWGLIRG